MINETKKNIEAYKALLPGLKERVAAVALMLVMSIVMMTSASYAWLTISRAPEVTGMNTTITGNGNLEIALAPSDGSEPVNSTGGLGDLLQSNVTWGNLVNLSDNRYGLDEIFLRPALLSGYNRTTTPLYGASYGEDGRVDSTSEKYGFASYTMAEDGTYYFAAGSAANNYGVRAISSMTYSNVTGDAKANALIQRSKNAYSSAQTQYLQLIQNGILISSEGVYPEVKSMDALSMLLQVYVQDRAGYYADKLNNVDHADADYSGVVAYAYRLSVVFQEILEKEGEGLVYLANLQAFKADANRGTETFTDIDALLAVYKNGTLGNYGVTLDSLTTYYTDYIKIQETIDGLKPYAEVCDPDDSEKWNNRPTVLFSNIQKYINNLVVINSTAVAEYGSNSYLRMDQISSSTLTSFLSIVTTAKNESKPMDVLVSEGIIARTEQRLPETFTNTLGGNNTTVTMYLTVKVTLVGINWNNQAIYASIRTNAAEPFTSNNDRAYSESLEGSGNSGDAVANDTYGMALDLWVRTNVSNVILTLEGSLVTEEVTATTVDKNGTTTTLYTLTSTTTSDPVTVYGATDSEGVTTYYNASGEAIGDSTTMTNMTGYTFTSTAGSITLTDGTVATAYTMTQTVSENQNAYKITVEEDSQEVVYWYNADTHVEIGKVSELTNVTATEQKVEIVTGYDGVNRVWEDYLSLIEAGLMAEHNTTQGAGSCYVFYADPSDQTRILHLLEAFSVVFMDQDGVTLGTAKLDTDHYYSINGKTTVPLKMIDGEKYEDEDGNQKIGITALEKNEATWITAIIYLDGQRLSNADVLAVGEIEGSLNIQFGSSISLNNQDDTVLRNEQREIEAVATYGSTTSSSSQSPITFEYDGTTKEITVTLTVVGKQPNTIKGFFLRSISATQGTRGETVAFTPNGDNTWSATFELTRPGTYSLRNLIVDGADYALDDGTDNPDENGNVYDSFPTVMISGMGINSVSVTGINHGITMTADRSVAATVRVSINATAELMPKQMRALFRSSDGREFTALLSNEYTNELQGSVWSGVANITESGTYTLQYLVMDGEYTEIDPEMQTTHIVYLGLTAQVWSSGVPVQDKDGNTVYSNTFEFKGNTNIGMQIKIYDGSGNELKGLEDVWLYYHNDGSVLDQDGMYGQVTWNALTGYYEGTLQLKSGGTFVFDRVVTNKSSDSSSTISKATLAPTFLAYVTDPPVYEGHNTTAYQFVPNGGATMTVKLTNAQTATIWAMIQDTTSGTVYMVPCVGRTVEDADTNLYQFTFNVPKVPDSDQGTQDGDWQMIGLYMQGCANADEEWVGLTEDPLGGANWITLTDNGNGTWATSNSKTVTKANYFTFDLTDTNVVGTAAENLVKAYVVQTVYVNDTASDKITFNDVVFGATDTNSNGQIDADEITGTFMEAHIYSPSTAPITMTITDWAGKTIELTVSVKWDSTYSFGSSSTCGGYTAGSYDEPDAVSFTGTNPTFTLEPQTLQVAGMYTSAFTITIGGTNLPAIAGPNFEVWSITPSLKISGISPKGSNPTKITYTTAAIPWYSGGGTQPTFTATGNQESSFTSYAATLYALATADNSTQRHGSFTRPTLTLTVAGVTSDSAVNFVLPGGSSSTITFSRTGNGAITQTLGTVSQINSWTSNVVLTHTLAAYYGHGTQTISEMTVTVNGVEYTVTLENPIVINNPSSVNQ